MQPPPPPPHPTHPPTTITHRNTPNHSHAQAHTLLTFHDPAGIALPGMNPAAQEDVRPAPCKVQHPHCRQCQQATPSFATFTPTQRDLNLIQVPVQCSELTIIISAAVLHNMRIHFEYKISDNNENACWSLLSSAILRSRADSLHLHVILQE